MTPEAQRIAIAEACGWTEIDRYQIRKEKDAPWFVSGKPPVWWTGPDARPWLPDFLNDLNAMREVELAMVGLLVDSRGKKFDTQGYDEYVSNLYRVVNELKPDAPYHWSDLGSRSSVVSASAAQRAEALLRTLKLWTEE